MPSIQYPLTIYYDASCPMCRSEMETLKAHDIDNKLVLRDCSDAGFEAPNSCPVTKDAMMDRIHAIDANGQWIDSTDVFAAAYAATGFNKIANFWGNERLQPLFKRVYPWVADNRGWLSKTPLPLLINWTLRLSAKRT